MDYPTWLEYGVKHGYVSPPLCATHDELPSTTEGDIAWRNGEDPCEVVLRVWAT